MNTDTYEYIASLTKFIYWVEDEIQTLIIANIANKYISLQFYRRFKATNYFRSQYGRVSLLNDSFFMQFCGI